MILRIKKPLAWTFHVILVFQGSLLPAQEVQAGKLNLVAVDGEGIAHNIRQRKPRDVAVRVMDENGRPAATAAVVFTLPSQGPSGVFPNGSTSVTVVTDSQGTAVARALKPNSIAGNFEIRVNASWDGRRGQLSITQFNMDVRNDRTAGGNGKLIGVLVLLGAAAAGGAVAGLRKSGNTAPPPAALPPITLTPGAGSVAPPQ